eukprot:6185381-Pleurochrysis_carterae.AAC.3
MLRHRVGNGICLPVALRRKSNALAVYDCFGQPGHGVLGQGAHRVLKKVKAVADTTRIPGRAKNEPNADLQGLGTEQDPKGEQHQAQRQQQLSKHQISKSQRLSDLEDLLQSIMGSLHLANNPGGRGMQPHPLPYPPSQPHPPPTPPLPNSNSPAGQPTLLLPGKGGNAVLAAGVVVGGKIGPSIFSRCGTHLRAHS